MDRREEIKCITVCQPYAHLIATGEKRVENRTWPTPYRGPLLIQAGKSRAWLDGDSDSDLLAKFGEPLHFGAIVGRAALIECLHIDQIVAGRWDREFPWLKDHHHTNGPWCWVLDGIEHFATPIPYVGRQRLFAVNLDLVRNVELRRA